MAKREQQDDPYFSHGEPLYDVDLEDLGNSTNRPPSPTVLDPRNLPSRQDGPEEVNGSWSREEHTTTEQPRRDPDFPGSRRPIPVSTIDWRSTNLNHLAPQSGLQFLAGVEKLEIQQTVELEDLLATVESENRYNVKVPGGETLFVAAETSLPAQRLCLGSSRAFHMRLLDASQQEALHLSRRLACTTGLLGCCYLQRLLVVAPPGRYLGCVRQTWTLLMPALEVLDDAGRVLYRILGPGPCVPKEAVFKVTSNDGLTELGTIWHQWKASQATYTISIVFPSAATSNAHKALLLGAAFLLEYMYFEMSKKKSWLPCC